jgi:hypothetical protein
MAPPPPSEATTELLPEGEGEEEGEDEEGVMKAGAAGEEEEGEEEEGMMVKVSPFVLVVMRLMSPGSL